VSVFEELRDLRLLEPQRRFLAAPPFDVTFFFALHPSGVFLLSPEAWFRFLLPSVLICYRVLRPFVDFSPPQIKKKVPLPPVESIPIFPPP